MDPPNDFWCLSHELLKKAMDDVENDKSRELATMSDRDFRRAMQYIREGIPVGGFIATPEGRNMSTKLALDKQLSNLLLTLYANENLLQPPIANTTNASDSTTHSTQASD